MSTLTEQLTEASVIDDLTREENPLSKGDLWHSLWWETGRATSTGWTQKSGEDYATAIWVGRTIAKPCFVFASIAAFGPGDEFMLGSLHGDGGVMLELHIAYVSSTKVKLTLEVTGKGALASTEVSFTAGDTYYLVSEEGTNGVKVFKRTGTGEPAKVLEATISLSSLGEFGVMILENESSPGTARIKGFGGAGIEPEPVARHLAKVFVGGEWQNFDDQVEGIEAEPKLIGGPIKTFRLALNTTLADPIEHPDDILICQWWHTERMEAARELGSKVLIYQNLTRAQAPEEGRYGTGLTLAQAEALGAATEEVDHDGGNICLPGTAGYAEAWLEAVIARAEEVGADGVLCDDMNAWNEELEGGYSGVTEAEWNTALEECNAVVGPGLSSVGLLGIPNMSGTVGQANLYSDGWLENQFQYYDGGLDEFFVTWPGSTAQPAYMVEEAMKVMARQCAKGKLYLAGSNGTEARLGYPLALLLAQTNGNGYVFYTAAGSYGEQAWPTSLQEALELGCSVGPAIGKERRFLHGTSKARTGSETGEIEVTA